MKKNRKILALVPMKSHSERVKNKNMRTFGGQPLLHAIMKTLQESIYIYKIVINTDSKIIANETTRNFSKAVINERPTELLGDFVSMNKIINYDIIKFKEYDHFIQTHSTNPLLSTKTLDAAIEKYFEVIEKGYDSVFGVTKFQSRFYWQDGNAINHNPKELIRTQDLTPIYEENSNFYIFSRDSFKKADNKRIGLNPYLFEVNKLEAIDIDNNDDFFLAEVLYKSIKN